MYYTTLSGIFTFFGLFVIAACFNSCTTSDLEGDPRKISIYTVEVKRTDVDLELQDVDCATLPADPCYCLEDITGGNSIVAARIKNCGDEGTAEQISITTTIYPQSGSSFTLSSSPINPQSLAQDSVAIISFSTGNQFTNIDSVTFALSWQWAGGRTTVRDTISSITQCASCR